jgi:translation initiation factor 2B subunit (eIF-2B alpha/beta/delta family)
MPDLFDDDERRWLAEQRSTVIHTNKLLRRLETIQGMVENEWSQHTGPPWYTFHGPSHNFRVETMIYRLIPEDRRALLTEAEWNYLLASVWLHDTGMIMSSGEDFQRVRDTHHERSGAYIEAHHSKLGLDGYEYDIVREICKYHRKKEPIGNCRPKVGATRVRLLSAYLRLADALHVDSSRIDPAEFERLLTLGMPWESRFHWLKSKWIPEIAPHPEDLRIDVSVYDTPEGSLVRGLLPQLVNDEVREELDSVRDVLIRGQITFFLDVNIENCGTPPGSELAQLEMILSNIRLENVSSASGVADSIIRAVLYLAEAEPNSCRLIRDYMSQIKAIHRQRPCHTLIQSMLDTIDGVLDDPSAIGDAQRVERIKQILSRQKAGREAKLAALAKNAEPFLLDRGAILLFGYSRLVLEALRHLPQNVKEETVVYIAEGRCKTQYNHANELRYCDGLNYAIGLREVGLTQVKIVPDVTVGSLMARALIKKVVFGANGIDREGRFGHTAGHLTIAALAGVYHVPVYVIADTDKFGKFEWYPDLERKVQWLARDRPSLAKLERYGIGTMNVREDRVEANMVTMLITDAGAFPPTRIPEYIISKMPPSPGGHN